MQQLSEQQVRHWINSIFEVECLAEDCERAVSPVARAVTLALADVPYVDAYNQLGCIKSNPRLRKFRAFLGEVVQVMDDCGVRPWIAADDREAAS